MDNNYNLLVSILKYIGDHFHQYNISVNIYGEYSVRVRFTAPQDESEILADPRTFEEKAETAIAVITSLLNNAGARYPKISRFGGNLRVEWNAFLQAGHFNSISNMHDDYIRRYASEFRIMFLTDVYKDRIEWCPIDHNLGIVPSTRQLVEDFMQETRRQGYNLDLRMEEVDLHHRGKQLKYIFWFPVVK